MQINIVAVIAAHPDDEILGCGGTLAKHIKNNDKVHILILAEGITGRDRKRNFRVKNEELLDLHQAAYKASQILGAHSLKLSNFSDNRMDSIDLLDIVKEVEDFIFSVGPNIVYTHFSNDVNIDHKITYEAVITACRPLPKQVVRRILFFETVSSTEWRPPASLAQFSPNWFVDISDTLDIKLRALEAYNSEMREFPHPRSFIALEHLARWRGATVGVNAAEAFILGRNIED